MDNNQNEISVVASEAPQTKKKRSFFGRFFTEKGLWAFRVIVVVAFVILWPILAKYGYFARLDGIVTPNPWPMGTSGLFFIIPIASKIATYIMGMDVFWKLSVVAFFLLLGYGGYKLIKKEIDSLYAIGFAVTLMMVNPFVYGRFIDGQMNIYWFLAVVPFWLLLLRKYFEGNTKRGLLTLILLAVVWIGISLHAVFMIGISILIFALVYLPKKEKFMKWLWKVVALGAGIGVGSIYYLYMIFKPSTGGNIGSFVQNVVDGQHLGVFATGWASVGVLGNVLSMRGYRGERIGRFVPSYGENTLWFGVMVAILILVVLGWVYYLIIKKQKNDRKWQIAITITAIISVVLAMGTGNEVPGIVSKINAWLFEYVPYYSGMREPQKWVVFLIPFYAYFGARGIAAISKGLVFLRTKLSSKETNTSRESLGVGEIIPNLILLVLMVLPSIYSYKMFWAFGGQVKMIEYPTDWYGIKSRLQPVEENSENKCPAYVRGESSACYDLLNLPRHSYMEIGWVGSNVLNPAQFFFDNVKVLSADNIEMGTIYTQTQRSESHFIDSYLGPTGHFWVTPLNNEKMNEFVIGLKDHGIKYILVIKQSPWNNLVTPINALMGMGAISIIHDSHTTTLFQIN